MKLKKILCLVLAMLMVFSMVACGKDTDDGENADNGKKPGKDPTVPTTTVPAEDDTIWVLVQESDMGSSRYYRYTYDAEGNLVAGTLYKDGKEWSQYEFVTTQTADGNKLVEQWYIPEGDEARSLNYTYTFDADGRLIHTQTYDRYANSSDYYTFSYNAKGQLVEQVHISEGEMYKKLTFVYADDLLMEGHYEDKNGNFGHYLYTYDENGNPLKADVHTDYMDDQQYTLEFEVKDGIRDFEVRATKECDNIVGGRRLFYVWEEYDEDLVEIYVKVGSWGIFHTGAMPLVSLGCFSTGNYFASNADLYYEPLEVHLAKQAENS